MRWQHKYLFVDGSSPGHDWIADVAGRLRVMKLPWAVHKIELTPELRERRGSSISRSLTSRRGSRKPGRPYSGFEFSGAALQITAAQRGWMRLPVKPKLSKSLGRNLSTTAPQECSGTCKVHHCFSLKAPSKDNFACGNKRVLGGCCVPTIPADPYKRGHSISIQGVSFRLHLDAAVERCSLRKAMSGSQAL